MTDLFALLGEPRRPWLDPEELKSRFLTLSAQVHPDRTHGASDPERESAHRRFAELNGAYQCLRDPKERLRHLLELERGTKPADVQEISSAAMECLTQVSGLCREADAILSTRITATSPLLKVESFERRMALADRIKTLLQELTARKDRLLDQIKFLNLAWESAPHVGDPTRVHVLPCSRLEQIYREYSYLARWMHQLQERLAQLMF